MLCLTQLEASAKVVQDALQEMYAQDTHIRIEKR